MKTVRLTMAQALVRHLAALRVERPDGARLFAGVFAIFGHGNVAGMGEALYAHRAELPRLIKEVADEGRSRPGAPHDGLEARELDVPLGDGLHEDDLPVLGLHEEQVVHEQHLAVAVAAALPPSLAVLRVEAIDRAIV